MHRWLILVLLLTLFSISVLSLAATAPALWPRQAIFALLGLITFIISSQIPFYKWLSMRWWLYFGTIGLLLIPFILQETTRNTARWIDLYFISLQPSQFALPVLALGVSVIAHSKLGDWQRLKYIFFLIGPILTLIFVSPNFSTTLLLASSLLSVIWFGRFSLKTILILLASSISILLFSWFLLLHPYQKERVTDFLGASLDQSALHYNALQAHIAIGHGGLFGRGWNNGSQSNLAFLPEKNTDFWFAAFAEQFGLIGSLIVLILLISLLATFYQHIFNLNSSSSQYLFSTIILTALFLQIFVSLGMNMGLLPITGLTLPFLSYGGSSILAFTWALGIAFSSSTALSHNSSLSWYNLPSGYVSIKE